MTPALPAVYGIVSTGDRWLFTYWEISKDPIVRVSEEYTCNFKGQKMESELEVLNIVATILLIQASKLHELYQNGEINLEQSKDRGGKRVKRDE